MAEQDFSKKEKNYYTDIPQKCDAFFLKGSNSYDWGMKNRLARDLQSPVRQNRDAGLRPWIFPGPDDRTRTGRRHDPAAHPLCRCPDADARDAALHDRSVGFQLRGHARERRPEHPEGAVERADRRGHGGRPAHERVRRGRAGLHRRRVRDPVGPQHDPAGGRGHALRHAGARSHGRGQGHGARRALYQPCHAHPAPSSERRSSRPTTSPGSSRSPRPARCRS